MGAGDAAFLGELEDESAEGFGGAFGGAAIAYHDEELGFSLGLEGEARHVPECGGVVISAAAFEGVEGASLGMTGIEESLVVEAKEAGIDALEISRCFGEERAEEAGFFEVRPVHGTRSIDEDTEEEVVMEGGFSCDEEAGVALEEGIAEGGLIEAVALDAFGLVAELEAELFEVAAKLSAVAGDLADVTVCGLALVGEHLDAMDEGEVEVRREIERALRCIGGLGEALLLCGLEFAFDGGLEHSIIDAFEGFDDLADVCAEHSFAGEVGQEVSLCAEDIAQRLGDIVKLRHLFVAKAAWEELLCLCDEGIIVSIAKPHA